MMTTTRRIDFSDVLLYAVTPEAPDSRLVEKAAMVLDGGADALQLRVRGLTDRDYLDVAQKIGARCRRAGALFLVNDRVDIAVAAEADGVHLGQNDMPVRLAREILGHRKLIGVSAHTVPEALSAQRAGADYVSCGPLFATPTKPDYQPTGLQLIPLYRAAVSVPFVAIGGIDRGNLAMVLKAGARAVAIVRALFDAPDPAEATFALKDTLRAHHATASAR